MKYLQKNIGLQNLLEDWNMRCLNFEKMARNTEPSALSVVTRVRIGKFECNVFQHNYN